MSLDKQRTETAAMSLSK